MNEYTCNPLDMKDCNCSTDPVRAEREDMERIAPTVRDASMRLSSIFTSLVALRNFVDGTSTDRSLNAKEPNNLREELQWQRSMTEMIYEELLTINDILGV